MSGNRGSWYLLTGGVIGILLGLLISLVLLPVEYTDTEPYSLREKDRAIYREMIAQAYLVEGDTPRALARLALLKDPNPANALVEQAQSMLAQGGDEAKARSLALLAAAINQPSVNITPLPVILPTFTATAPIPTETTATPTVILATRTPMATITPRPTFTPQPTQGAPFTLVKQSEVCDPDLKEPLIQVFVVDASEIPVPGVKIEISQPNSGVESFYTGLYPEISRGYADYSMLPGMTYNLRVGEAGQLVLNLSIPACKDDSGTSYPGSIRLDFKQPD